jgi:hypothetical protein
LTAISSPHLILGAPPAYPGLSNRPVANGNAPPAYSPSFSNPPAYNPSFGKPPGYYQNSHYPGAYSNNYKPNYGSSFGNTPLAGNTYIYNNYYGGSRSGSSSSFLTNALFFGVGMHSGFGWGSHRRSWDSDDDRRWRSTTKAPYFENKVPGSENYLPAAAVVGAATAFGLASLLPLNVPANKPLMYCNGTDVAQNPIYLDFNIYSCANESVAMSCPRMAENSTVIDECLNQTMICDTEQTTENLYCTNGTLLSRSPIFCNSITLQNGTNVNQTTLNCYQGQISQAMASFIPTTTTEAPIVPATEKELSLKSKIHVFFMKLVGKSDIIEKAQTPTTAAPIDENPRFVLKENETLWVPEALTIPPETNTTDTTEVPIKVEASDAVKIETI